MERYVICYDNAGPDSEHQEQYDTEELAIQNAQRIARMYGYTVDVFTTAHLRKIERVTGMTDPPTCWTVEWGAAGWERYDNKKDAIDRANVLKTRGALDVTVWECGKVLT